MDWMEFASATVSGIVTAIVWAGIAWLYLYVRASRTREELHRLFQPAGISLSVDGFGVPIKNSTSSSVIIRQVVLHTTSNLLRNITLNYKPDRLTKLPPAAGGSLLHQAQLERGFIELPPQCGGTWVLPNLLFSISADFDATGCSVTVEHVTFFGDHEVVTIKSSPDASAWLKGGLRLQFQKDFGKDAESPFEAAGGPLPE